MHKSTPMPPILAPNASRFLVMGVPRSGTTALTDALNMQPHILCGIERFQWPLANAVYPFTVEDFLDSTLPDVHFHERNMAVINEKQELAALGNKKPRYYVSLPQLLVRAPARLIFTYRHPGPTAMSWNARAQNPEDAGWQRGMTGLYAFMEFLQMLLVIRNLPKEVPALVVSYDALLVGKHKKEILQDLITFLDVVPDEGRLKCFVDHQETMMEKLKRTNRSLYDFEETFLQTYHLNSLEPIMQERPIVTPKDLHPAIDTLFANLQITPCLDDLIQGLSQYPTSSAFDFFPNYLTGLFSNAGNSTIFEALDDTLQRPEHRKFITQTRKATRLIPAQGPNTSRVLEHWRGRIKEQPQEVNNYVFLGEQLLHMHLFAEAEKVYAKAKSLAPYDLRARTGHIEALHWLNIVE